MKKLSKIKLTDFQEISEMEMKYILGGSGSTGGSGGSGGHESGGGSGGAHYYTCCCGMGAPVRCATLATTSLTEAMDWVIRNCPAGGGCFLPN